MSIVHDGPGVLPGRYPGPATPIHHRPTPQELAVAEERAEADALAGRICVAAAMAARSDCQLLDLIGEFDAIGAIRWWTDVKSLAHWLSWCCSMSPGTAREHVRVAKALRRMPTVRAAFAEGRLSYSKVREATRVVDVVDEARLCELALTATASQLARMVAGFRAADGSRVRQQLKRQASWRIREDGMVEVRACLPPDEGALLVAALTAAKDQFGAPPVSDYSSADALLDVARGFLDTAPEDRSGEDRRLVVLHVSTDSLVGGDSDSGNVPAGTIADPNDTAAEEDGAAPGGVPAGTPPRPGSGDPTCHVDGVGPVERETARRFCCDADLLGAVVDEHREVLALGRTRRLVSRAQRRALMIRDQMCRFPGCAQTRHLDAHHVVSWLAGGPTDLENLILLCRFHHTFVHEGGMTIRRIGASWTFVMPDGTPHRPWYSDERLPHMLAAQLDQHRARHEAQLAVVDGFNHPAAQTIRPRWAGERFDLHECVHALFGMKLPEAEPEAA